jgi:secreted trypsin-like serine protease
LILSACGGPPAQLTDLTIQDSSGIIGGKETTKDNVISKYVVLIYDTPTKSYCTGLLISNTLILTAAHCVEKSTSTLTLAFGLQPMKGNYILRQSAKTIPHPDYKKANKNDRHDTALIASQRAAPKGYEPLLLPDESFPLQAGLIFTATGYGRTSGKPEAKEESQGFLRHVELIVASLSEDEKQFYVDQKSSKGICNGDSGGPALMRYLGKDYVVGIASAISWTTQEDVLQQDVCSEKSIYINLKKFRPWIQEASRLLTKELLQSSSKSLRAIK